MAEGYQGVLQSKFNIPSTPSNYISRPNLLSKLQRGTRCKLTLISAPAGFGKTSLVSYWLKNVESPHVWISMSREDNDPVHLAKCFIEGGQKLKKTFGETILKNLASLSSVKIAEIMRMIIKEMEKLPDDFMVILDDYHHIHSPVIQEGLTFFLNHVPTKCHIYILCRVDPPIPLARFKVTENIVEIREKDLRFKLKETEHFLNETTGIQLAQKEIKYFHKITEGWCAGLRMISFSIKTRENTSDILKIVADTGREISFYLEQEVFSLQNKDIQFFLLTTSILSTLTPSLCNAVSGRTDSRKMLGKLEKLNLFIILLDHKSSLYRYHHFFSDMLQARLAETYPDKISVLHLKASKWYLKNNSIEQAVFHAYLSQDELFHADMVESHAEAALIKGEFFSVEGWIKQIPESIIQARPALMIYKSIILILVHSKVKKVEAYNIRCEKILLEKLNSAKHNAAPRLRKRLHGMIGRVYFLQALTLAMHNQFAQAKKSCRDALKYVPKDGVSDVLTVLIYGYCSLTEGKIDDAEVRSWEAMSLQHSLVIPHIDILIITMTILIELHRGKLSHADSIVTQAISKYKDRLNSKNATIEPCALLLVMKGEILREKNQLDEAEELLSNGIKLIQHAMPPNIVAFGYNCLSRTSFSKGDLKSAQKIMNDVEKRYWPVDLYLTDYLPAYKARIDILEGNLEKATQFVKKCRYSRSGKIVIKNDIHYSEFLTIARYYISKGQYQKAIDILEKILENSKSDARMKRYLEALILISLAFKKNGNNEKANFKLTEAVHLSSAEGYCRIFLDEGDDVTNMLRILLKDKTNNRLKHQIPFIESLVQHQIHKKPKGNSHSGPQKNFPEKCHPGKYHIDPLTKRELEVLSQLSKGLRNKEIGDQLCISLATVKTHIHKIISKLNVDSRNKAVIEAKKLGLIKDH